MKKFGILVTCSKGISPVLAKEVLALGLPVEEEGVAGVWTRGTVLDVMRLNLHIRTGIRVLRKLDNFNCDNPDTLYRNFRRFPWEHHIPEDGYMCVSSSVRDDSINDTRFPNQKAKDAICDRLRAETGKRPDTGPDVDGTVVFFHWHEGKVNSYLDTSGIPLSKRGYRLHPWMAPMAETLAAATVLGSGWDGTTPFINPMCGSGTLGIEAAWIAMNRAPGLMRQDFGFFSLKGYEPDDWKTIKRAAREAETELAVPIVMSDHAPGAIEATRANLDTAGLGELIQPILCEMAETPLGDVPGTILVNPPYGERLGEKEELVPLYQGIGNFFKRQATGFTGAVFSGNPKLIKQVKLKPQTSMTLYNAKIECRLNTYDLYPV